MRTIILDQNGKFIQDRYENDTKITNYEEKINHMLNNGYGSIKIDGLCVHYEDTDMIDGDRYVYVNVEIC